MISTSLRNKDHTGNSRRLNVSPTTTQGLRSTDTARPSVVEKEWSQRPTLLQLETERLNVLGNQQSMNVENTRIECMKQIPEAMPAHFTHSEALLLLHSARLIAAEITAEITTETTTRRQCMSVRQCMSLNPTP